MSAPRILLTRFAAMGDCVMAAWAATAIRDRYPDSHLVWAIESRWAPVVDRHRLASQVYEIPRERWKRHRGSPKTWSEQISIYTRLRRQRFDWGFDLQGHSKTAILLRLAAPKQRVAARATDIFARSLNPVLADRPAGIHTVEWNHRVVSQMDAALEIPSQPMMPPASDREQNLVTIAVGTSDPRKTVDPGIWRQVAEKLVATGKSVFFVGGPRDPAIDVAGAKDFVGKKSLAESIDLIAQSRVHLAADTGAGHVAAAYGVPVVSLFGPTNPVEYRPFTERGHVLVEPSMKFDVDRVMEAVEDLW